MATVLVVGASGVLGQFVCKELVRTGKTVVVSDYKIARGRQTAKAIPGALFREVDVRDERSIREGLAHVDGVVVVAKQEEPLVQKLCLEEGIPCIDVTVDTTFIGKMCALKGKRAVSIMMAGFIPGLSGLLVKEACLAFEEMSCIKVALLQSTNAQAGVAGTSDMLQIISEDVDGKKGFKEVVEFPFGKDGHRLPVRKINHLERKKLRTEYNIPDLSYFTAWDDNHLNKKLSGLHRFSLLPRLAKWKGLLSKLIAHNPSQSERAYLTVEAQGKVDNQEKKMTWMVTVESDYEATAFATVAMLKEGMAGSVKGVKYPFEVTSIHRLMKHRDPSIIQLVKKEE